MINYHGIRRIIDADGVAWEVWEAHPRLEDRRRARSRRAAVRIDSPERRVAPVDLRALTPDAAGWLVFKSAREERRRTPIPPGWEVMSEAALVDVLRRSRLTGPIPRARPPRSAGTSSADASLGMTT